MIEEPGEVVQVRDGFAWVETRRRTACDSCGSSEGCGTGTLSKAFGRRSNRIRVVDAVGCKLGDAVVLGLDEAALLRSSLVVYAVPLVLMMLAALAGRAVFASLVAAGHTDVVAMVFGLLGLGAGFLWARRFALRAADDSRYQPVILRHNSGGVALVRRGDVPDISH